MNLGISEMAFIFVLALLLFGPKKLPELGRQVGRAMAQYKRAMGELQAQINQVSRSVEREAAACVAEAKPVAEAAPATALMACEETHGVSDSVETASLPEPAVIAEGAPPKTTLLVLEETHV